MLALSYRLRSDDELFGTARGLALEKTLTMPSPCGSILTMPKLILAGVMPDLRLKITMDRLKITPRPYSSIPTMPKLISAGVMPALSLKITGELLKITPREFGV